MILRQHAVAALVGSVVGLALLLAFGALAWSVDLIAPPSAWSAGAIAVGIVIAVLALTVGGAIGVLVGAKRTIQLMYRRFEDCGFGLCPGVRQPGYDGPGLSDWLHRKIQDCAALPSDQPLTYGHLDEHGIHLETVTTNLNYSRPFRLPFEDEGRFLFRPAELERAFPREVVRWMQEHPPAGRPAPPEGYFWVPARTELPVIIGARMSLSFPALISAIPLHGVDEANPEKPIVTNWFSDGGISSNFPIHFFDGWLPSRPTFGLNLNGYPTDAHGGMVEDLAGRRAGNGDDWAAGDVFMPLTYSDGQYPRWTHFSGPGGFIAQIVDTMENWRDNMQSELPGFRDRICEIRLYDDEGGMHLTMPHDRVADLIRKGDLAGDRLLHRFDWAQHRWTRFLMLMETLQVRLEGDDTHPASEAVDERFRTLYAHWLENGPPDVPDYVNGHDRAWCVRAKAATEALLDASNAWGAPPPGMRFDLTDDSVPAWAMRITPKV